MPVAEFITAAGTIVTAAAQLVSAGIFLVGVVVVGKYLLDKLNLGDLIGSEKKK